MTTDRWLVLSVHSDRSELLELAAAELIELGGTSVVEEPGSVSSYLSAGGADALAAELRGRLPAEGVEVRWRWQEDQDWAREWKRGLQPRRITDRVVVKPTWCEWDAEPGQVVIDIDPQMAFGTGEHATTRGCLRLLDGVVKSGARALDVGSGSAILAIAAARLGAGQVIAVEYDPDANLNARENLERNGVERQVRIVERMADAEYVRREGPFDLILANILSGVIRPLLPAFRATLREPGGALIVSGILQSESDEVCAAAGEAGFQLVREDREDEWWSALLLPAS